MTLPVDWKLVNQIHATLVDDELAGFHDYSFLREMVLFISTMGATSIIESGTAQGTSTKVLAQIFPQLSVYTCDCFYYRDGIARDLEQFRTISYYNMDSRELFPQLVTGQTGKRPFFFLDAHKLKKGNPTVEELQIIISKLEGSLVTDVGVCIHDFQVPDSPQFGWNGRWFDGTDLTWETIKFVHPFTQGVWYPPAEAQAPNLRGRIYLYLALREQKAPAVVTLNQSTLFRSQDSL